MIYGHDDQSKKPLTLREVAFQLSPAELRRVAAFLISRAAEIESGAFTDGGRHLRDDASEWAGFDVIVVPPLAS